MRTLFKLPYLTTERLILRKKDAEGIEAYDIALKARPREIIGQISYEKFSWKNNKVELTFVFSDKHWDKVYATEAAKCLIMFCFEGFQISQIQSGRQSNGSHTAKVSLVNEGYFQQLRS